MTPPARSRLPGGIEGHKPQMVSKGQSSHVGCSCGKWLSKPCDSPILAYEARRDFDTHVAAVQGGGSASPVNVNPDFDEKRKRWGLVQEQMLEMAASVFKCLRCRKEYMGSECHTRIIPPPEGILCDCQKYRFVGVDFPDKCPACARPLMVSLDVTWRLVCPDAKCRGELVRVKGGSSILDKSVKFFGRALGKIQ